MKASRWMGTMGVLGLLLSSASAVGSQAPDTGRARPQPPGFARSMSKQFPQVFAPYAPNPARDPNFVRIDIANTAEADKRALGNQVGNFVPISSESVAPTAEERQEFAENASLPPTMLVWPTRSQKLAGLAVSAATNRGAQPQQYVISPIGTQVRVLNSAGVVLTELDDNMDVGQWRVVSLSISGVRSGPSYCSSGVGHPVWGRQWCVRRNFGVGSDGAVRWARALDAQGVVLRRGEARSGLRRNALASVFGDVVLNRLAIHAITLGMTEPLTGQWRGGTGGSGPNVLLVSSGTRPLAELVDLDRDGQVDLLLVAMRPR